MTRTQKIEFINDLIMNVQSEIILNVGKMPDDWDGHELRRYIADKFNASAMTVGKDKSYARRFREYKNTVIVQNL